MDRLTMFRGSKNKCSRQGMILAESQGVSGLAALSFVMLQVVASMNGEILSLHKKLKVNMDLTRLPL
jgi:hypothetical protein